MLAFATEQNRAILTLNRKHFVRLHAEPSPHAGIDVCTFDANFTRQAQSIHETLTAQSDLTGQLLRVTRPA